MPMHTHENIHGGAIYLKEVFTRELFEIYFILFMKKLVLSMIGLFLPLYLLLELNYSFNTVIYFFLVMLVAFTAFLFIATEIIARFGAKHSIILGMGLMFVGLLASFGIEYYPILFYPAAILLGAEFSFFWMGFHIDAAVHGTKKTLGKKSAVITIVGILPSIIGPFLGGVIIKFSGFPLLFIVALILGGGAVVPLMFSKETFAKKKFSYKELFRKEHKKYFLVFFAQGVKSSTRAVFWPIFIFTILGSYISLGIYGTVATLVVSIFGVWVGKISDEGKKTVTLRISAAFGALFWFIKVFITTVWQVFTLGILGGFTLFGSSIPILAKSYKAANKEHVPIFILFRELSIRCGQFFVLLLVLFTANLKASFIASAITAVFYFLI